MTVTAHLDSHSLSVDPGSAQRTTLHIRNEGDIVESYRLSVVGAASDWTELEPSALTLYPGTDGTVAVTFRPPRSHQLAAQELAYAVRVVPTERPQGATVPEGVVRVLPFHELDVRLLPKSTQGRLRARSQVGIENRGNTAASVLLAATDPTERLRCSLKPAALVVGPGERAHVDLAVRARKRLWRGRAKVHPHQVTVETGEGTEPRTATLPGSYEQLPILPGWLFAAVGALAALVALWFALVRPTVQSAARQSVDAQVKQAVQAAVNPPAVPGAGGQAPAPGGSSAKPLAGPGASPGAGHAPSGGTSGGASGAPSAGSEPAGGNGTPPPGPGGGGGTNGGATAGAGSVQGQFSTRLDTTVKPGSHGEATFQVPADRMLLITDIVAEAPQGDEGVLTVSIDGTVVSSLALENFRDHDSHWVTPVQASPKSRIVLSVACRKPGTPPDASASTACVESLFVNGQAVAPPSPSGSPSPH
ncbi:hypothetical protein GCM10009665_00490 [Kitasatospora nipponensis]|uniref:Hydrolytic protein n=1 Tax=Kitasatospora nipponensis TaxID=258049 RepID=A0ABP4G982_9ACTN